MARHLREIVEGKTIKWSDEARKKNQDKNAAWSAKYANMSDAEKQKYKDKASDYHYSNPIKKKVKVTEESELNELGEPTLKSYDNKWKKDTTNIRKRLERSDKKLATKLVSTDKDDAKYDKNARKFGNRLVGKIRIADRLAGEFKAKGQRGKKEYRKEETELDEARRKPVKKNLGSMKADVKTQSQVKQEKRGRMKSINAAIKQKKETGEKVTFRKFSDWRKVRAGTKRKIQE